MLKLTMKVMKECLEMVMVIEEGHIIKAHKGSHKIEHLQTTLNYLAMILLTH